MLHTLFTENKVYAALYIEYTMFFGGSVDTLGQKFID